MKTARQAKVEAAGIAAADSMMTTLHKIAPEVRAAIEATLKDKLKGYELESFSIEPGEDHDGDEAIFIELNYKLSERPFDSALLGVVRSDLRRRLIDLGELRFPYTRHQLHKGQKFKE
jgi:hypothetical protein